MVKLFAISQMVHLQPNVFFQQEGGFSNWGLAAKESLNETFADLALPTKPLAPSLLRYKFIAFFGVGGLRKVPVIPSESW
jgi:hypothetical protein